MNRVHTLSDQEIQQVEQLYRGTEDGMLQTELEFLLSRISLCVKGERDECETAATI